MSTAAAVWLDVIPSMRGFGAQLAKQGANAGDRAGKAMGDALEGAAKRAGRDAGEALAHNVELAKERVQIASKAIVKARDAEADAAGRVTVAQAKLDELTERGRSKGKVSAAQMAVATERLGKANRGLLAAQQQVTEAEAEDERAKVALTAATRDLDDETKRSSRSIVRLTRNLNRVDTKNVDKAAKSFRRLSAATYATAAAVSLLGGSIPVVAGLASVIGQVSGAALLMPGALMAGGAAVGVLALGVSGIGDALKEWDDPEKFAEAIENLSVEAQRFAIAVRDLRPELIKLRNSVQAKLFAGSADEVKALAKVYLPLLSTGLAGIAGEFGDARRGLVGFATDSGTLRDMAATMGLTKDITNNLVESLKPLLFALRDMGIVGISVLADITKNAGVAAQRFADFIAAARQSGQIEQWIRTGLQALRDIWTLLTNVGNILREVFNAAAGQGTSLLGTLNMVTGSIAAMLSSTEGRETLNVFFRTLHDVVQNLQPGLNAVMSALMEGIRTLGPQLPSVAQAFSDIAVQLAPLIPELVSLAVRLLPPIVSLVRELAPLAGALAAAWLAGTATLHAYNFAVATFNGFRAIVGFIRAWAAGQVVLNNAMRANVIGVIITAIVALITFLVYLFEHNEAFRSKVIGAWEAIKKAISFVWESILKPVFAAIVAAVMWVGDAAVWLWQNAFLPAAQAIGAAASWLWNNILKPTFDSIATVVKIVAAIIITFFVTPAVIAFRVLAAAAMWLWEHAIKPAFDFIGKIISWLWTTIIVPVFAAYVAAFKMVADAAMWLWNNGIKPAFDFIAKIFNWLWTTVISFVIDMIVAYFKAWYAVVMWLWDNAIKPTFDAIGAIFTWLWENVIKPVIEAVKIGISALGDAFRWVWESLIKPAWDALGTAISWVWDNVIKPVFDAIKSTVATVGQAFSDAVKWISDVWSGIKEALAKPVNFMIRVVYMEGIRAVWNKVADFVGIDGLPKVDEIKFGGGGVLSGYAPGRDSVPALLSPGEAVLVPELVRAIGARNILAANARASGRPGTVAGPGFAGGGVTRFAGGGIIGTISSWVGDLGQTVVDLFSDPAGFVRSRIGGSGDVIEQLARMPAKVVGKIGDFLWSQIKSWFGGATGGDASSDLAGWLAAAMRITGVGANWASPLTTLIMRESGGNPKAINLWDSNAQAGHPSQGLMQTIPSTFAAYRDPRLPNDITDPVANIVAGINYIRARYGSIFSVQQAVGRTPMGYDQGGYMPPGITTVYNGTGRPEPVLSPSQWDALQRNGGSTEPMHIAGTLDLGGGLEGRIDGRIYQAQHSTGTAIAARRRV